LILGQLRPKLLGLRGRDMRGKCILPLFLLVALISYASGVLANNLDVCSDTTVDPAVGLNACNQYLKENKRDKDTIAYTYPIKAEFHAKMGDFDAAIENLTIALRAFPTSEINYRKRGVLYLKNKHQPDKAVTDFVKAVKLYKRDDDQLLVELGSAHVEMGEYNKAIEDFTDALKPPTRFTKHYALLGSEPNQIVALS
jgi:tetratricopeptide (TPR) repeat protein